MPLPKGYKHSAETRAKMSQAKLGLPHSEDRKAKISAANKGKVRDRIHHRTCACGHSFVSGVPNAVFCSQKCRRASHGHGLRHAPQYAHFPKHCEICGSVKRLVGDHEHSSGKPRGILCSNCNLAIGNMFDDPGRLRAAAAYLER